MSSFHFSSMNFFERNHEESFPRSCVFLKAPFLKSVPLMALMGRLAFQGNVAEFLPFFRYCERVNLGKQSAFGLGRIRVWLGDEFGVLGNVENREGQ